MSQEQVDYKGYEKFTDEVKEGILQFKIEADSTTNHLLYMNKVCENKIGMSSDLAMRSISLESLLQIERDKIPSLVSEKYLGKNLQENKMLRFSKEHCELFLVSYNVFTIDKGYVFQVTLKEAIEDIKYEAIMKVENYIEGLQFDEGYIGLLIIKNYNSITQLYDQEDLKVLIRSLIGSIETAFGSAIDIHISNESYLMIINKSEKDVVDRMRKGLDQFHELAAKEMTEIIWDIKIGLSTCVTNKYTGLHEAKYTIDYIYNRPFEVVDCIVPNEEQFLEYAIKSDLPYAIEKKELRTVFQGIFNIQESFLYGFEVLVRWHHTRYGDITPNQFIPIAEQSELITEIDLWVVEEGLKEFERLEIANKKNLKLNFNISPRDFFVAGFVDSFIELIEKSNVDNENVILELTETLNLYPKRSSLQKIKEHGIMIALDDFGTGFSSLSQIKHYNIDFLKIDISFIRDINVNYDNTQITNAILALADSLNISVIAEGVDGDEQISFLKNRKCEYVQGFRFHKPMFVEHIYTEDDDIFHTLALEEGEINYKDYVKFYKYGKFIYMTIDRDGELITTSDLLTITLNYELRKGENIQVIIAEGLGEQFMEHLNDVNELNVQRSFMTEVIGLKESVPVKVTMIPSDNSSHIDLFVEDYRNEKKKYDQIKNIYNRYDLIFKKISTAIVVYDLNLNIQEWNKQAETIFGYKRNEILGSSIIKNLFKADQKDLVGTVMAKTLAGEETEISNAYIDKDGDELITLWQNTRLVNDEGKVIGIISWIMDITEKVRVDNELNYLSTIIKQDPSPIILTTVEGQIEYVNEAFTNLTGYDFNEVINKNPRVLSSGLQSKEYYENMWHTILSGDIWQGEFRNKKKDGTIYTTSSRIFPIKNESNDINMFCCIQKDVTYELEHEHKVIELNETLESQERLSMIGQMAAGIMHEINNPLSFIDINVHALDGMLDEIELTEDNKEVIEELHDLGLDLKDGVSSIKSIAAGLKRFVYKSHTNEFESVSINEEVETIVTVSKNEYKYYSQLTLDLEQVDMVYANAGKIKQVLLNLIINAVHAIREKGDDFEGRISIKTYQDEDFVYCDVSDNGTGIPVEARDKIFEMFYTTKKNGRGTGLGLGLSKKIIESEHKGLLYFTTELGVGTTFTVKLKRQDDEEMME